MKGHNPMAWKSLLKQLCLDSLKQGNTTLLEPELYEFLQAGGLTTPDYCTLEPGQVDTFRVPERISSANVVVKVVSPLITHKTELGGVKIAPNTPGDVRTAIRTMLATVRQRAGDRIADSIKQVMVCEFVPAEQALGGQLFAGIRWTHDMGHVVTLGFGGLDAEELAARFKGGQGTVLFSPELSSLEEIMSKLESSFLYRRVTGRTREARAMTGDRELRSVISLFGSLASEFSNKESSGIIIHDFEINPFFVSSGRLVAVDAFMRFGQGRVTTRTVCRTKVHRLLKPSTAAIVGPSRKGVNVGRIILRNLLREQYPIDKIRVVRDDSEPLDGVACVPSVKDLPFKTDLLVVAVPAERVPAIVQEAVETANVASMILIPGGMGETEGGKASEAAIASSLESVRQSEGESPVLVGPNCLGIRSLPGRYDTLFIPEGKLPLPKVPPTRTALLCQSGAFMISRISWLNSINPCYCVSTGNQLDLTVTDFVDALLDSEEIDVFGLYIEGFKPLDGLRLSALVKQGRKQGKDFILYKAGRTNEGITATSSHTASISGDYRSCVEVMSDAGALIANTFEEFKMYLALASTFGDRVFTGRRLAVMSNAGFETVGVADNVSAEMGFSLPAFSPQTTARIGEVLKKAGIAALVNIKNPLDLTPMASDAVHAACLQAVAADPSVDAVVMGFIPMTVAMRTLPPGADPTGNDSVDHPQALPAALPSILAATRKPVVTVVDSGPRYTPLVWELQKNGIISFRSSDAAMQAFQTFIEHKVKGKN